MSAPLSDCCVDGPRVTADKQTDRPARNSELFRLPPSCGGASPPNFACRRRRIMSVPFLHSQTFSYSTSSFGTSGLRKFGWNLPHRGFANKSLTYNLKRSKFVTFTQKGTLHKMLNFTEIEQRAKFANFAILVFWDPKPQI